MRLPFGLRMAKKGFKRAKHSKPMGCAYVKGSKIIIGGNDNKTSPLSQELGSPWARLHAEVNVLKHVEPDSGGTLFIYREKKNGHLGMARPCDSCMTLIRRCGIKILLYTTDHGIKREEI